MLALAVAHAAGGDAGSAPAVREAAAPAADAGGVASPPPAIVGADSGLAAPVDDEDDGESLEVPSRLTAPPLATAKPLSGASDLRASWRLTDGGYVVGEGAAARRLTVDPTLQRQLTDILKLYQTPWAAVVALEPQTGRVLAMAEHSEEDPGQNGLCTRALYPAASIFKVVTASALLQAGVEPTAEVCFHGGKRKITADQLTDSEKDTRCETMADALANSANLVFAKLTLKHLDSARLLSAAQALHFNRPVRSCAPQDRSMAAIPLDGVALARAGAGFGDVWLSPMHGAALAGAIANHGLWREPTVFEAEVGTPLPERVMPEATALALAEMMALTVEQGTARRQFKERGYQVPGAVGKTGSLADKKPFRDYTWFVGYAPHDNPKIAVAAVIVNGPRWRIRATWLGREALRLGLGGKPFTPGSLPVARAAPDAGTGSGGLPAAK